MSQADLHGSGSFRYPTADEYEAQLLATIRDLARDVARLAEAQRDSEAAVTLRDRVDEHWERLRRDMALLRAEERRETRRVARDLLHARLNTFLIRAEESPSPVALLTWQQVYRDTVRWLAHWSGNGS